MVHKLANSYKLMTKASLPTREYAGSELKFLSTWQNFNTQLRLSCWKFVNWTDINMSYQTFPPRCAKHGDAYQLIFSSYSSGIIIAKKPSHDNFILNIECEKERRWSGTNTIKSNDVYFCRFLRIKLPFKIFKCKPFVTSTSPAFWDFTLWQTTSRRHLLSFGKICCIFSILCFFCLRPKSVITYNTNQWLVMDEWMTCNFTSFLTVFQTYQDDVWMIMKGCVQGNSVYGWEDFTSSEDRTRPAGTVGQRLTYWATEAPKD